MMYDESILNVILSAAEGMLGQNERFSPLFWTQTAAREDEQYFEVNWNSPQQKLNLFKILKQAFSAAKVKSFFYISEGWTSTSNLTTQTMGREQYIRTFTITFVSQAGTRYTAYQIQNSGSRCRLVPLQNNMDSFDMAVPELLPSGQDSIPASSRGLEYYQMARIGRFASPCEYQALC